jgi:hypothetical protein
MLTNSARSQDTPLSLSERIEAAIEMAIKADEVPFAIEVSRSDIVELEQKIGWRIDLRASLQYLDCRIVIVDGPAVRSRLLSRGAAPQMIFRPF